MESLQTQLTLLELEEHAPVIHLWEQLHNLHTTEIKLAKTAQELEHLERYYVITMRPLVEDKNMLKPLFEHFADRKQ